MQNYELLMISWQLASLMFIIRQSGTLKLLLFQLGYRKFFDPETPRGWKAKIPGVRGFVTTTPGTLGSGSGFAYRQNGSKNHRISVVKTGYVQSDYLFL